LITPGRASRLTPQGYRSPDYSLSRRRNWAAIQPPLQKDDSTLRLAYSALELSPWAMPAHAVGNPGRPGRADVARQAFSSIAAMYLCWPALLRRPLAVRSRLGPNVDGVAGGFKEVSYYHRVTPCGLSNRARGHPFVAGLPPRRSPTLGSVHFRRRGPWFPESGLCSHRCGPWACGIGSPTRSAGVSMDAK